MSSKVGDDYFIEAFRNAVKNIPPDYFKVPVSGGKQKYLERVYTYELYHQLRKILEKKGEVSTAYGPCRIHGEHDKRGHKEIKRVTSKGIIPDLIVHVPGTMKKNLIAIEIKSTRNLGKLKHDLDKLKKLTGRRRGSYSLGFMLIFGDQEERVSRRKSLINKYKGDTIKVFWHKKAGTYPEEL